MPTRTSPGVCPFGERRGPRKRNLGIRMLAPLTKASGAGLAQHPSRHCAFAATTHRNRESSGRRVSRSFVVGSERLGEAPTVAKHSATLRVPNTLAMVGSLWQGRNALGGCLTRQAFHRSMAEHLASRQMLHLHNKLRLAPLNIHQPG